jgi:meso-butanediol dehydrogenase/(S,S)-butanediol dehydrogenase/diacetyl reductase
MATYDFRDRVAVVTGAASGIGWKVAQQLAAGGARIVAVDRNKDRVHELVRSLPVTTSTHIALTKDIRSGPAAQEVVPEVLEKTEVLDILVNSAGVCHFNRINTISVQEWDEVMEIDVRALYYISTAAADVMDPVRGGRIINLGSNAGRKGRALSAHYAAAKAAVANITESLALAYGSKKITVNTVCPGPTETPMWDNNFRELKSITGKEAAEFRETWSKQTPLGRIGTPEDVANLIAFLASDRAAFITGQEINVCGGFMLTS